MLAKKYKATTVKALTVERILLTSRRTQRAPHNLFLLSRVLLKTVADFLEPSLRCLGTRPYTAFVVSMDRHEFHRMAHQDDRHSHQTIPFPSEERREVRIISPHNSMYPFPRGSFLFEPTHPDTVSYPTVQLRRMAPSLGVCARLSDVCHPSNKRTFSNDLGDSMRHEVTRWVGTIGLKRAESYSQDVYPNRQMHSTTSSIPMGYYAVQQSQRTTSCLGMIARTLVRRPLQFRGSVNDIKMNRSSMTTYSESERPSFSEQTRTHHGRESTQRK